MKVHATGDQVYACDGSKWILRAPDAKLFDESGQQVGTHFAGPTWRWSDGSQVTGKAGAQRVARSGFDTVASGDRDGSLRNGSDDKRCHDPASAHKRR